MTADTGGAPEPAFLKKIGPAGKDSPMRWLGHPGGLATLFFTEMWERFSYYGMRALLILFMTAPAAMGGFGWPASTAGPIYGLYTAMVYITALPGGWIADRLIGQRMAVLIGAIIIMSGHISLMFHGIVPFYIGLFLIVVGTGLLKPNISWPRLIGLGRGVEDVGQRDEVALTHGRVVDAEPERIVSAVLARAERRVGNSRKGELAERIDRRLEGLVGRVDAGCGHDHHEQEGA